MVIIKNKIILKCLKVLRVFLSVICVITFIYCWYKFITISQSLSHFKGDNMLKPPGDSILSIYGLNSVYTRSGQNSTPNSNATNLHSSQKRCCSFCISSSNASPTFQVQKSIFHQMTKPIQVTVILPLLLAISFSRNDDIHSSISGISNDLIGVIPTIGQ